MMPKETIKIKSCALSDAETMALIHAIVLPAGWGADEFYTLLKSTGVSGYLAVNASTEAYGMLILRSIADECEILALGILKEMRRQGLAREMITHALKIEKQRGVRHVHLEVQEDNASAIAFYESLGFLPSGRRKNYYATPEGRKDAILMHRTVI